MIRIVTIVLIVTPGAFFGPAVRADDTPQRPEPTEATVEKIMDQAVRNIARRYNLNEAQTQKTDEIMKREVRRFLKEHEKEVWPLMRDLLAVQFSGKPPENKEDAIRIGKGAAPLAELAEKAIFEGNKEWREFLTAEQKRIHDDDLDDMRKTFAQVHKNFDEWEKGTPSDSPLIPPPPANNLKSQPPRPKMPPPGLPDPVVQVIELGVFEAIVDRFLKEYDLDQGQIDTARSILAEFKIKANDFQLAHRDKLKEIAAKQSAAQQSKDLKELAEAEAERKALLDPFHGLVAQMEERLKSLLTSAQIEAHNQRITAGENKAGGNRSAGSRKKAPTTTTPSSEIVGPPAPPPAAASAGPKNGEGAKP